MATTRIKDKISAIVSSQLPEYVRNDFPTFVAFVEAYYKFVEQDQNSQEIIQNLLLYSDIDSTSNAFVKYFLKNYAQFLSEDLLADKKLTIKKIKDLYESKGSTLSFKLFFRLFFNEEIRVNFPYENVLIPSGGNFLQRRSLRVTVDRLEGISVNQLVNRFLRATVNNQEFNTPIIEVNTVVNNAGDLNDVIEVFLDVNFLATSYAVGDNVTVSDATDGGNLLFSGNIQATTTEVSVTQAGTGFKKGQIYTINGAGGSGTKILIDNVTATGGINEVSFLSFGHSFTENFNVQLNPEKTVPDTVLATRIITDNTNGFLSHGNVFHTGNGQIVANFGSNTSVSTTGTIVNPDSSNAILQFNLGALAIFPGEFTTNKGFLSEPDIRLQNDLLFQPFAYELVTGLDINTFRDVVLDTIHPAGQRLFNNRELSDILDVRTNISTTSSDIVNLTLFDSFTVDDSNVGTETGTGLVDSTDTLFDGGIAKSNVQSYFAETYCVNQDPDSADSYITGTTETF